MSQLQERIAQFRKMANDDPDNELGHFRLGQLLMEDNQFEDAAKSFARTLILSPQFSKVFQLLGECRIKQGMKDEAIKVLREGWAVADGRGDKMPRDAMGKMLVDLGETPPQPSTPVTTSDGPGGFACQRPGCPHGNRANQLTEQPLKDAIGERIQAEICSDCWSYWLKDFSIKVINELRLDLSTDFGQSEYDRYLREYLGFAEPANK